MTELEKPPPPGRDWRDARAYDELRPLDRGGFAWEYLRRNSRYGQNPPFSQPLRDERQDGIAVLVADGQSDALHWGLLFRRTRRHAGFGGAAVLER